MNLRKTLAIAFLFIWQLPSFANDYNKDSTAVFFGNDRYQLDERSQQKIDSFIRRLTEKTGMIRLTGYANQLGDSGANLQLSERRVLAVKEYLLKKGIPEPQIQVLAAGEKQSDTDPASLNRWRRVDLFLLQKRKLRYSLTTLYFDLNTTTLVDSSLPKLDTILYKIKTNPDFRVNMNTYVLCQLCARECYPAAIRNGAVELRNLTALRTDTLVKYLEERGIPRSRLRRRHIRICCPESKHAVPDKAHYIRRDLLIQQRTADIEFISN